MTTKAKPTRADLLHIIDLLTLALIAVGDQRDHAIAQAAGEPVDPALIAQLKARIDQELMRARLEPGPLPVRSVGVVDALEWAIEKIDDLMHAHADRLTIYGAKGQIIQEMLVRSVDCLDWTLDQPCRVTRISLTRRP